MPTSRLTGSVFPDPAKQQPYEYGRRSSGRYASVPYESVSQSTIDALAASADAAGLNYKFNNTFGKSRIVIEYNYNFANSSFPGSSNESEQVWEIVPTNSTKDLLDSKNPQVQYVLAGTTGNQEVQLLKNWQRQNTLETNLQNADGSFKTPQITPSGGGSPFNFSDAGIVLAKFIFDGVSQVDVPQFVLTHTSTVTLNYIDPTTFNNVGLIYSNSTLLSTENIPSAVLFDMPVNSDPSPILIAPGIYQVLLYGWLKGSPSVRQSGQRKWNIVQSYTYGLWGIALYGGTRL
jgi:hypothetical protein